MSEQQQNLEYALEVGFHRPWLAQFAFDSANGRPLIFTSLEDAQDAMTDWFAKWPNSTYGFVHSRRANSDEPWFPGLANEPHFCQCERCAPATQPEQETV